MVMLLKGKLEETRATTSRPGFAISIPGTPGGGVTITSAYKPSQEPGISYRSITDSVRIPADHVPSSQSSRFAAILVKRRIIYLRKYSEHNDLAQVNSNLSIMTDGGKLPSVFVFPPKSRSTRLSINNRLWKAANTIASPGERAILSASTTRSHTTPCVPGAGFCAVEGAGGFDA